MPKQPASPRPTSHHMPLDEKYHIGTTIRWLAGSHNGRPPLRRISYVVLGDIIHFADKEMDSLELARNLKAQKGLIRAAGTLVVDPRTNTTQHQITHSHELSADALDNAARLTGVFDSLGLIERHSMGLKPQDVANTVHFITTTHPGKRVPRVTWVRDQNGGIHFADRQVDPLTFARDLRTEGFNIETAGILTVRAKKGGGRQLVAKLRSDPGWGLAKSPELVQRVNSLFQEASRLMSQK